jgi:hypothetical protein
VTFVACARLRSGTPLLLTGAVLVVSGVFRSVGFTAFNTIAFADIAPEHLRDANPLSSTLQQLAVGLGVAAGDGALRLGSGVAHLTATSSATEYSTAFVVMAVLVSIPVLEVLRLGPEAGAALRIRG